VWLLRSFFKLSKDIKFTNFGLADLKLFRFEVGTSIAFDLNELNQI
jgi:hypothetical protein